MDKLNNIVLLIQHYLADYILIILLLGGGVIFTIRLGFIQIRGFKAGWKRTFGGLFSKKGTAGKDGMSSFQALATAIAAQVGTGNIAGAATALAIGGPGAIFWMWIAAFLGMATIFGEAIMAQKYKHVGKDGHVTGGPVYYIQAAFKGTFGKNPGSCLFCSDHFCTGIYGKCGTVQLDSVSISYCIWYTTDSGGDHYSGYRIVCICRRNFQNCKSYRDDCSNHGMFLYYRITDCNLCKL